MVQAALQLSSFRPVLLVHSLRGNPGSAGAVECMLCCWQPASEHRGSCAGSRQRGAATDPCLPAGPDQEQPQLQGQLLSLLGSQQQSFTACPAKHLAMLVRLCECVNVLNSMIRSIPAYSVHNVCLSSIRYSHCTEMADKCSLHM